jgi:glycosyltransferase involved in cell wall biosynthesis
VKQNKQLSSLGDSCVSVIIPAYNSEKYIGRAISSALQQGRIIKEILVYDDCSTDNTFDLISLIEKNNPLVRCYKADQNLGAGFARRFLMRKATGKYFAFLDADDYWLDDKIKMQIHYMADKQAQVCTTDIIIDNIADNSLKTLSPKIISGMRHLLFQNPIPMSSAVVLASLDTVRDMSILRARQDYAYWLTLFKNNKNIRHVNINKKLVVYTRSATGLSGSKYKNIRNNFLMYYQGLNHGVPVSCVRTFLNVIGKLIKIAGEKKYE